MKRSIMVSMDKFKESMSAPEACRIIDSLVTCRKDANATVDLCPLTDGGEGFVSIFTDSLNGQLFEVEVSGPLMDPVQTRLGIVMRDVLPPAASEFLARHGQQAPARAGGKIAFVEMATCSGLADLPPERRDPWKTTSRGTGEAILRASQERVDAIVLGIGGSATNDCGIGALQALGLRALDTRGKEIENLAPANWSQIATLDGSGMSPLPPLFIACDVSNPLLGPDGCTRIYGPQKGLNARTDDLSRMEAEVERMALLMISWNQRDPSLVEMPGAGAAGGIAFGFNCFFQCQLIPGFDWLNSCLELEQRLGKADVLVTGEGRFDQSSLSGKGPGSLVRMAIQQKKPTLIFCGSYDNNLDLPDTVQVIPIAPEELPLNEAIARGPELLRTAAARVDWSKLA